MTGHHLTEAEAGAQLRDIGPELESIRLRLLGIHEGLPAPEAGEEEEEDRVTLRSVIECVLNDSLEPAIHDLRAATAPEPDADT